MTERLGAGDTEGDKPFRLPKVSQSKVEEGKGKCVWMKLVGGCVW